MLDEFDTEIDPSIREEREEAERQRELDERVTSIVELRLGTLMDAKLKEWQARNPALTPAPEPEPEEETEPEEEPEEEAGTEAVPEKPRRKSKVRKAASWFLSAGPLSSPEMKRLYPYMLAVAGLLLMFITSTFYIQKQYRQINRLEKEIKELRTRAVWLSSERVQQTSRSGIVGRIKERGMNLEESDSPVKIIE